MESENKVQGLYKNKIELSKQAMPVIEGMLIVFSKALEEADEDHKKLKKKLKKFKMINRSKDPEFIEMNNDIKILKIIVNDFNEIIDCLELFMFQ